MTRQIAVYGKGGIGKSTISANLTASLADMGRKVVQIGCDPKHDSTRLLLGRTHPFTVLDQIRKEKLENVRDCILEGYKGALCIEAGGPEPGVGCAGRGILSTLELLGREGIRSSPDIDYIIYDVLGDVVCGGFAVPLRKEYADTIFIVTSGEFMSLYAANNIIRGIANYETDVPRIGGIVLNSRGGQGDEEMVEEFALEVGLPIVARIPRHKGIQRAEEMVVPFIEAYPDDPLSKTFKGLAEMIENGIERHYARPLGEEKLESCVLKRHRQRSLK
ncbi:MAG TPA: nitrogenase iron protein NifH [Candidatus Methanofastidiosa archaeon]|nr:nitrogenase iron protein NifH [Candidatus Methanofastidiosa archaeon]